MSKTAAEPPPPTQRVPHVRVSIAEPDGWDVLVEVDGRIVAAEHCTGWHRAERHRTRLEAQFQQPNVTPGDQRDQKRERPAA